MLNIIINRVFCRRLAIYCMFIYLVSAVGFIAITHTADPVRS